MLLWTRLKRLLGVLSKGPTVWILGAVFVGILLFLAVGPVPYSIRGIREASGGHGLLDTAFGYRVDEGQRVLDLLGENGRASYRWYLAVDGLFALSYGMFLSVATFALLGRGHAATMLATVPLVAMLFDWVEGISVITALSTFPDVPHVALVVASAGGVVKHIAFYGSLVIVIVATGRAISGPQDRRTKQDHARSVEQTYLALRWAMLVIVGLLMVAVVLTGCTTGEWQTSLSAYYYTAARPVFVAALCAIGTCLVLYHAGHPENVILDLAGFFAFIVAFVPTTIDRTKDLPGMVNVPTAVEVAAGVRVNVGALLAAGIVSVIVAGWLWRRQQPAREGGGKPPPTAEMLMGCLLALAFGAVVWFWAPLAIESHAHYVAAFALFVGLFLVVVTNARGARAELITDDSPEQRTYYKWYTRIAIAMLLFALLFAVLGLRGFQHWIFWAETVLIALFASFWQLQTRERETGSRYAQPV